MDKNNTMVIMLEDQQTSLYKLKQTTKGWDAGSKIGSNCASGRTASSRTTFAFLCLTTTLVVFLSGACEAWSPPTVPSSRYTSGRARSIASTPHTNSNSNSNSSIAPSSLPRLTALHMKPSLSPLQYLSNNKKWLKRKGKTNISSSITSSSSSSSTDSKQDKQFKFPSILKSSSSSTTPSKTPSSVKPFTKSKNTITPSILAILLSTSLNLLGFTMTSPLSPNIATHFELNLNTAKFGSLTSAYPLGMLLGLFIWPRLSDLTIVGRKAVMVWSLVGSGFGLLMQAIGIGYHWNLKLFLAMRVFTGCFAGSSPVAKAFLADVVTKEQQREKLLLEEEKKKEEEKEEEEEIQLKKEKEEENHMNKFNEKDIDNDNDNTVSSQQMTKEENKDANDTASSKATTTKKSNTQGGQLSKYLAWRDASSTLAYIIGPALGGFVFEFFRKSKLLQGQHQLSRALSFVIGITALASFVAASLVSLFVVESDNTVTATTATTSGAQTTNHKEDEEKDKQISTSLASNNDEYEIISCPLGTKLWSGVATVCVISFLYHIADSTFFAFFPAILKNTLSLDARQIGMTFTALACVSFSVSASSLSSRCITKLGVVNTCVMGLTSIGFGLLMLALTGGAATAGGLLSLMVYAASAFYFAGVPLYGPTIPTMLLQCVPPHQRGTVMGVDGAVNTMARVIAPLVMGDLYRRRGSRMVFGVASGAVLASASMALFRRFLVLRDERKLNSN